MSQMQPSSTLSSKRRNLLKAAGAAAGSASLGFPAIVRSQGSGLNVGVLLPTSGVLAFVGQSCKRGVDIAPQVLADMGYGSNMKVMFADFESNVDVARARAEKLINDGANILVGPFDSGAATAIAQVCEQKGVPFVINIAAAPPITEQGYKFVFRNFPTSVDLIRNGLGLMRDMFQATNTAPRTAVFMHVNDTFGLANRQAIERILPTLNYLPFRVVETISYDREARDLSVEVAKAKATNADFVMVVSRLNDAILLRREMVKQRYSPMGIVSPGSPGMYEEQYFKVLGKLSDHSISNVPWYNPKSPMFKRVEAAFKKAYPQDKIAYHALNAGFTFEAMLVAADAYKRAGSTNGRALADAIRATNITERVMLGGPLKFNAKGQVEGLLSACVQNSGGEPRVVLPTASAEAKLIFPVPKA
jgi:branched-chain amino acid transport system substrate-binding protein